MIPISFVHRGNTHTFDMQPGATVTNLAEKIQEVLNIPVANQKFMVPKMPLLKPPFGDRPITDLQNKKITLLGTTSAEIAGLTQASEKATEEATARQASLAAARAKLPQPHNWSESRGYDKYTFTTVAPLPGLPRPERSLGFLERLRDDPGIRAVMRKHKFKVGLLTEMEPLSNTQSNHEGTTRILGLNRNMGDVIELRLRTDAYDGYRDYKTIRNTLCHELTHNVHSEHDRQFWDLCHQIEREVAKADWRSGGHTVGGGEYYQPDEEEIAYDHGGWTGGQFVLGRGPGSGSSSESMGVMGHIDDLMQSRREIMAKAAEERMKRQKEEEEDDQDDP